MAANKLNSLYTWPGGIKRWVRLTVNKLGNYITSSLNMRWHPQRFTKIALPNTKLTEFHVGPFINLLYLDLHSNSIWRIRGSGIEQLSKLIVFNISYNSLSKVDDLAALAFLGSMESLYLSGNPVLEEEDYSSFVIYTCRHLKGSNHQPGLRFLDGLPVTPESQVPSI